MTQPTLALAADNPDADTADAGAAPGAGPFVIPTLSTARLVLNAFTAEDVPALARILANPEVVRGITANSSTPARARKVAAHRIGWHNKSWDSHGHGIWAVRLPEHDTAGDTAPGNAGTPGALIGWCGFSPPDLGTDPELLYGLDPRYWGQGLAHEAASAAIDWLLAQVAPQAPHLPAAQYRTPQQKPRPRFQGISLVVFGRLNPASLALATKLGFERKGRMSMADFMPDRVFAKEVVEYEIWRLGKSRSDDPVLLLFQAAFKAGQIASLLPSQAARIELALCDAACQRRDMPDMDASERLMRTRIAFQAGLNEPHLDWLHRKR
ncbi:MAG: GNAT family N-acetyltransferase [Rhodospirillaceae bacterium]|nr:GNAT family N-acetyltransferase [Rhodospirillaceae bacterium]